MYSPYSNDVSVAIFNGCRELNWASILFHKISNRRKSLLPTQFHFRLRWQPATLPRKNPIVMQIFNIPTIYGRMLVCSIVFLNRQKFVVGFIKIVYFCHLRNLLPLISIVKNGPSGSSL